MDGGPESKTVDTLIQKLDPPEALILTFLDVRYRLNTPTEGWNAGRQHGNVAWMYTYMQLSALGLGKRARQCRPGAGLHSRRAAGCTAAPGGLAVSQSNA